VAEEQVGLAGRLFDGGTRETPAGLIDKLAGRRRPL
jgi:hypothetical protein